MVRPERLRLHAADPPTDAAALPVTCTDLVFQGAVLRYVLRDARGNELIAHVETTRRDPHVRIGASLWLAWAPDAARLLHPDGAVPTGGSSTANVLVT
jgi:ABC-type Fe3+/spermidine/putrescine transport system ATPase subunit